MNARARASSSTTIDMVMPKARVFHCRMQFQPLALQRPRVHGARKNLCSATTGVFYSDRAPWLTVVHYRFNLGDSEWKNVFLDRLLPACDRSSPRIFAPDFRVWWPYTRIRVQVPVSNECREVSGRHTSIWAEGLTATADLLVRTRRRGRRQSTPQHPKRSPDTRFQRLDPHRVTRHH